MIAPTHEEHFEAICSYLGTGMGSPENQASLRAEALEMIRKKAPTEDMVFDAIFMAYDFELVQAIKETYGTRILTLIDPHSGNVRPLWRSSRMSVADNMQVFTWMVEAWKGDMTSDPGDAMLYAIETGLGDAIAFMEQLVKPSVSQVAEAIIKRRGMFYITRTNLTPVLPLIEQTRNETEAWKDFIQGGIISEGAHLASVALAAKCGVDMTPFAGNMLKAQSPYQDFLAAASSQHGRMRLMEALPEPSEIIQLTPPQAEQILRAPFGTS